MGKSKWQDYIVYDTETGGLPSKVKPAFTNVALTEVALVYVNPELEIIAKTSFLLKPHYKEDLEYHPRAMQVSHLTLDILEKEGITLEEAWDIFTDFINSYQTTKTKPIMVGHNIDKFDNAFMENWALFMKSDLYKYVNKRTEDTLDWGHRVFPEAPDYKLGTMCDQFGVELTEAHRALPDTIANAELWIKMMQNLRGEGVGANQETVDDQAIVDNINKFQF